MGNNDEIRKRMETYRGVLLVLNWIMAIALIIAGFAMMDLIGGVAFIIVIVAAIFGIIGHFMINVGLAIPFILLNNGDYLAAIVPEGKIVKSGVSSSLPVEEKSKEAEAEVIESATVRKKPDENSGFVFSLDKGVIIEKLKTEGEWTFVRRGNIEGWCKSSCLKGK